MPTQSTTVTESHKSTDALVGRAHTALDRAANYLGRSEEKLRSSADHTRAAVAASLKNARTSCTKADAATRNYVQRHPLRAIGIALGVGAVVALLSRSRTTRVPPAE